VIAKENPMFKLWSKLSKKPWLRAQACLAAMGVVLLAGSGTYAAYRAKDAAKRLGSEILTSVDPQGSEVIEFNGARFNFSASVVEDSLESVVERASKICEQENQDLERELTPALKHIPASALVGQKLDPSKLLTLQSADSTSVGEVGCWARRKDGSAPRRFMDRVKRFAETGDLSELGSLSYLRAERHGTKTFVRMLWSEGPLSMGGMFPTEGDVPGEDLKDVPRPEGAARILSARILGTERRVVGYDTKQSVVALNDFYARALVQNGWKELELGMPEAPQEQLGRAYERGGKRALLALTPSDHGTSATWVVLPEQR
jgi:hypothetical protein